MKVKILYTALISLIAGGAMAQDCTFFFPQTEGTVWVRKGYDAKGNLQYLYVFITIEQPKLIRNIRV